MENFRQLLIATTIIMGMNNITYKKSKIELPIELQIEDSFFEDEIRSGYLVTSSVKKIWAVELDLLNKLITVCHKYNIQYFAFAGTELGAIRHKGFIPWDDDIDIAMLRDDYEKFCSIALEEFTEPYFFQSEDTDRGSLRGHVQIRNSKTTGILHSENRNDINQGIFIDVFPLDNVPDNNDDFSNQVKKIRRNMVLSKRHYKYGEGFGYFKRTVKSRILHIPMLIANHIKSYKELYKEYRNQCMLYNNFPTKRVGAISRFYDNPRFIYNRVVYENSFLVPFEMLNISVCSGYEENLMTCYGNWQEFIIGKNEHGSAIFDTNISYKDYCMP